ncbi:nicotinate-nucleotide adenylyltransferase [Amaricoccus tamworthensis]|uniref:nicotinate-nucleotide adenylyltransferase n=1 Tax=Amaricoccus tamworthensis TaxID=57002 RepID=UPI003C7C47D3
MTVGLLGGSFDPAHAGHVHITRWALKSFGLSQVWWLVSPGNPLKANAPAASGRRLRRAREIMQHPRVVVTDLESRMGTRYTAATLSGLRQRYPGVRFVWLMGADNMQGFHRWDRWDWIMENFPVGVLGRPGDQIAAGLSPAARRFATRRLGREQAEALPHMAAPCWTLLTGRMLDLSSSELRRSGAWRK